MDSQKISSVADTCGQVTDSMTKNQYETSSMTNNLLSHKYKPNTFSVTDKIQNL